MRVDGAGTGRSVGAGQVQGTFAGDLVEGERERSNEVDSSWGSWSFSDALALQCRPRRQDVVPAERQCKVFSDNLSVWRQSPAF